MNVSLTPELEQLVQSKVQTGRYNSASEVVREALRLLEERDLTKAEIRKKIAEGRASQQRSELVDGEAFFAQMEAANSMDGANSKTKDPLEPLQPTYSDDGVDLTLIRWMLSLSPVERLRTAQRYAASAQRLRDAPRRVRL